MKICDRHFRGGREPQLAIFHAVHVSLEFRQLRCSNHAVAPDHEWRANLKITVLAGVKVEHELNQRPFQFRSGAGKADEPASTQLAGTIQIEQSQFLSD